MDDRERMRRANRPTTEIRPPADRHFITRFRKDSPSKQVTTLIEPRVDVHGDIERIREGYATRIFVDGAERYVVRGRTWQVKHPSGTLFPVEGDGFIVVDQAVTVAMRAYARYNGSNEQSEYFLDWQGVAEEARFRVRRIWKLREQES
ncbi:MAG: hypothetical protein QM589_01315 [Thermomicrobiales bacterium]